MTKFTADYLAMAPIWGVVEIEEDFDDKAQFIFEAENYVRDQFDGATDIDIRNIREIA